MLPNIISKDECMSLIEKISILSKESTATKAVVDTATSADKIPFTTNESTNEDRSNKTIKLVCKVQTLIKENERLLATVQEAQELAHKSQMAFKSLELQHKNKTQLLEREKLKTLQADQLLSDYQKSITMLENKVMQLAEALNL